MRTVTLLLIVIFCAVCGPGRTPADMSSVVWDPAFSAVQAELLGTRIVDSGSGYDSQSVLPVHIGLSGEGPVGLEVLFPGGGSREVTQMQDVDPAAHVGQPVTIMLAR